MRPTEPAALSDGDTLAGPGGAAHHDLAPPARIGRYLVLHELGRGGMGVVLLAYDPELDRKVAVKLLGAQGADAAQQDRLLREAQAMARLAHPNVAAVFDVGVLGGQVYLAMEYVEGESLRAWLGARRPWRVVVDMFVQAGRGLAAAHAAGLVHRDFKPENAIVGRDGRVRVLDFGLAALGTSLSEGPSAPPSLTSLALPGLASRSLLSSRLTADGALVGTLAYMSPEQLALAELDPRSDQFSFFSSLHLSQPPAARKQGQMREIAGFNSPIIYRANPQDPPGCLRGFGENQETGWRGATRGLCDQPALRTGRAAVCTSVESASLSRAVFGSRDCVRRGAQPQRRCAGRAPT
jgi:serine/threonine protein kinase